MPDLFADLTDLEGGGPTGWYHPDTSYEGGNLDKSAQRFVIIRFVTSRGRRGANAYEIWLAWGRHPEWGKRPTANNINSRLGELAPNTRCKMKDPGTPRKTIYDDDENPILWWTPERRPAERRPGNVYVAFEYR